MAKMGRPKGSKNHQNKINQLASKYELTPLNYMLEILNNQDIDEDGNEVVSMAERMEAAKSAAPYVHPRLQSTTITEKPYDGDPNTITNEQLASIIQETGSSNALDAPKGSGKTH